MARTPLFALAEDKIARARSEMARLSEYLDAYDRSDLKSLWSRTATIAYALHSIYNGIEDVMADIARTIDGAVPHGGNSHQAILDQMHLALDGIRPALLDDSLYAELIELKSFRHLVRHNYGIDLVPAKVDARIEPTGRILDAFSRAVSALAAALEAAATKPPSAGRRSPASDA